MVQRRLPLPIVLFAMVGVLVWIVLPIGLGGDQATTVSFRGVPYLGSGADRFEIRRSSLLDQGQADAIPKGFERNVFAFPDISPDRVLVAFSTDGTPTLLISKRVFPSFAASPGAGDNGLAAAIPELCRYWRSPIPFRCGTSSESPP